MSADPQQVNSGQISYYFLGGTSMASPHVAGIVALMAQQNSALTASVAEKILETSAIQLPPGCRTVANPSGPPSETCWGADAPGSGLATANAAPSGRHAITNEVAGYSFTNFGAEVRPRLPHENWGKSSLSPFW